VHSERAARGEYLLVELDRGWIVVHLAGAWDCGAGNIYSSEALWRARLSPWRRSDRVGTRGVRALHKAIVGVLRAALECCLAPPPDFRDPQWRFQGLEGILRV